MTIVISLELGSVFKVSKDGYLVSSPLFDGDEFDENNWNLVDQSCLEKSDKQIVEEIAESLGGRLW